MNFYHQLLDSYSRIKKRKFSISIQEASTGKAKIQPSDEELTAAEGDAVTAIENVMSTDKPYNSGEVSIEKNLETTHVIAKFPGMSNIDGINFFGNDNLLNVTRIKDIEEKNQDGTVKKTGNWVKFIKAFAGLKAQENLPGAGGQGIERPPDPTKFRGVYAGEPKLGELTRVLDEITGLVKDVADQAKPADEVYVKGKEGHEHWHYFPEQYAVGTAGRSIEEKFCNLKGIIGNDPDGDGKNDTFTVGTKVEDLEVTLYALNTIKTILMFGTGKAKGTNPEVQAWLEAEACKTLSNNIITEKGGNNGLILKGADGSDSIYMRTPGNLINYSLERARANCGEKNWEVESLGQHMAAVEGAGEISDLIGKHREKIGEITSALAAMDAAVAAGEAEGATEEEIARAEAVPALREQYQKEANEWAESKVAKWRAAAIALRGDPYFRGGDAKTMSDFHDHLTEMGKGNEAELKKLINFVVEKDAEMKEALGLGELTFGMQVGYDVGSGKKADFIMGSTVSATVEAKAHELGVDMISMTPEQLREKAPDKKKYPDEHEAFLKKVNLLLDIHGITDDDTIYFINISEKFYRDAACNGFKGGEIKGTDRLSTQHAGVGDEFAWHHPMRERIFGDDAADEAIANVKGGDEAAREKAEKEARNAAALKAHKEIKEYDGELQTMRGNVDALIPIETGSTLLQDGTLVDAGEIVTALSKGATKKGWSQRNIVKHDPEAAKAAADRVAEQLPKAQKKMQDSEEAATEAKAKAETASEKEKEAATKAAEKARKAADKAAKEHERLNTLSQQMGKPDPASRPRGVVNSNGEVYKVDTKPERRLLSEKIKCEAQMEKVARDIAADGTPPPAGPARKWLAQTIQLVAGAENQELIHVMNSGRGTHAVMSTGDIYDTVCKAILNGEKGWTISTGSAGSSSVGIGRTIKITGPNGESLRLSGSRVRKGVSTTWAVHMNDDMVHQHNKFRQADETVEDSKERVLKLGAHDAEGNLKKEAVDMRSFLNAQLSMIQELLSD